MVVACGLTQRPPHGAGFLDSESYSASLRQGAVFSAWLNIRSAYNHTTDAVRHRVVVSNRLALDSELSVAGWLSCYADPGQGEASRNGDNLMNLDIGGFLTSSEFLTQIAAIISELLSAIFGTLISGLFGIV